MSSLCHVCADGRFIEPKVTDPGQAVRLQRDLRGRVMDMKADKLFGKSFRPPELYADPRMYNPVKVHTHTYMLRK